jgi:hypothetical protein
MRKIMGWRGPERSKTIVTDSAGVSNSQIAADENLIAVNVNNIFNEEQSGRPIIPVQFVSVFL